MSAILNTEKLRNLSSEELDLRIAELQKELYDMRVQLTTKELQDTSLYSQKKREYARTLTILREIRAQEAQA